MAKIKKRGTSGATKNYLTRSQAVRKLQISLGDFRRLCIFKGIYPREPRSKKRVNPSSTSSTTFYYTKDIHYLLHEPLLAKFREQKALEKKISKALGRGEVGDAKRWDRELRPKLRLDHVVKERYPTFVDALRDLDDALSLLFLFANLPSTTEVPAKTIAKCQRLTMEFEHYIIRSHSLRKSFLSIKGIYYQATIQGQDVLWLVPYKFVQRTGGAGIDVDFRIMATFVEFYTALLGFVNFRLYTGIGLVYPPRFDAGAEEKGAELDAFVLEGRDGVEGGVLKGEGNVEGNERAQAEADRLLTQGSDGQPVLEDTTNNTTGEPSQTDPVNTDTDNEPLTTTTLDTFSTIDPTSDTLLQPSLTADSTQAAKLFEPYTFFLSRETPRHPLEFLLKAFGGKRVGWDSSLGEPGAYCGEEDERVTHQVVDRPDIPFSSAPLKNGDEVDADEEGVVVKKANERVPGRIYIQPQWIWDSINAGQLQRPDLYAPGATLPPHLSPWVKARKGEYDPTLSLAEQETVGEAEMGGQSEDELDEVDVGSEGEEVEGVRGDEEVRAREEELTGGDVDMEVAGDEDEDGGMDVRLAESEDESDEVDVNGAGATVEDDFGGFSADEAEAELDDPTADATARQEQEELKAELLGRPLGPTSTTSPLSTDKAKAKAKATKQAAQAKRSRAEREEAEDLERRKMMMPRRKRKMFEKMTFSNARRDEEAERLRGKRRRIEMREGKGVGR